MQLLLLFLAYLLSIIINKLCQLKWLLSLLLDVSVETSTLAQKHSLLWDTFKEVKNKQDEEEYELLLADEELRAKFYERLSAFSKTLGISLSSVKFLEETEPSKISRYRADLKFFSKVVSLHPESYNPAPLELLFNEKLEDLVSGGPPVDESAEHAKVQQAVTALVAAWRSGHGVVVHCFGGRGRTGTVLGCVLRELGFKTAEVLSFLDRVHKACGKPGWPESEWQSALVKTWKADA